MLYSLLNLASEEGRNKEENKRTEGKRKDRKGSKNKKNHNSFEK